MKIVMTWYNWHGQSKDIPYKRQKKSKDKIENFFDEIDIKTPDPTSCLTRV